jgi:hypothetical protein
LAYITDLDISIVGVDVDGLTGELAMDQIVVVQKV